MITPETEAALKQLRPDFELCPVCKCCEMDSHWVRCHACGGEGEFDGYEDDPLWYAPGETERCGECYGTGGWEVHYCIGGCMNGKVHVRENWEFLED